jgi:hypothetical protein
MMVAEKPVKEGCCVVLHFSGEKSKQKASITETEESIFDNGCVHRIHYTERIDPRDSVQFLKDVINDLQGCTSDMAERNDTVQSLMEEFQKMKKERYNLLSNNCEHLLMFACVQTPLSIQISEILYQYLECEVDSVFKIMQQAVAKFVKKSQGIVTTLSTHNTTSLAHITGTAIGSAATKAAARTLIAEGAETAAESVSAAGYNTAVRTIALVTGGTVALGVSVIIEVPFLATGIYKIHRKNRFDQISSEEAKRQYTKQACRSTGVVVGATAGATAGTFIPVPFLGTFVGTLAGTVVGTGAGKLAGSLLSRLIKDGIIPDCAIIISHSFEDVPDYKPE